MNSKDMVIMTKAFTFNVCDVFLLGKMYINYERITR
jgi:hypothetical protein